MRRLPVGPLAVMAVAAALYTALALLVMNGRIAAFDHAVLGWLAGVRSAPMDAFFGAITWLGSFYVLGPLVTVAAVGLALRGRALAAWLLGLGFGGAALATWLAKLALARPRPALYDGALAAPPYPAFPSGHAAQAFAVAFGLCWLAARAGRWRLAAALACGVAALVALSRLYLQVHWPSDVLGGVLMALLWAAAAAALTAPRLHRHHGRP